MRGNTCTVLDFHLGYIQNYSLLLYLFLTSLIVISNRTMWISPPDIAMMAVMCGKCDSCWQIVAVTNNSLLRPHINFNNQIKFLTKLWNWLFLSNPDTNFRIFKVVCLQCDLLFAFIFVPASIAASFLFATAPPCHQRFTPNHGSMNRSLWVQGRRFLGRASPRTVVLEHSPDKNVSSEEWNVCRFDAPLLDPWVKLTTGSNKRF